MRVVRCPDDGACHHECDVNYSGQCWRVFNASPLSMHGDAWTQEEIAAEFAKLPTVDEHRRQPIVHQDEVALIPDDLLGEMLAEARGVLATEPKAYEYTGDYKGGPRNVDPEILFQAQIEMRAARMVYEEITDRALEATLLLYEKMAEQIEAGIPVEFIAEHSGFKHRASVYRVVRKQLPSLRSGMRVAQEVSRSVQP